MTYTLRQLHQHQYPDDASDYQELGVSIGTEATPWHWNAQIVNPFPNPLYPNNTMPTPGAVPSVTMGVRWTSDSGNDNLYVVADAINHGN